MTMTMTMTRRSQPHCLGIPTCRCVKSAVARPATGRVRSNLIAAHLAETENRTEQTGHPGV
jgi:hypothetical protein